MSPHGTGPEKSINIVYFERWADPVAEEILKADPRIRLVRLLRRDSAEKVWAALAEAHGYQVTSSRSDTDYPPDNPAFFSRCPNLLAVSTGGAGYDTVNVKLCTGSGLIAVNQTGLNKQAVAEHVVGMMLALSKRMIQSDRAMRRERGWKRLDYQGDDISGKTIGIVGFGNIGTTLSGICRAAFGMRVLACDPYVSAEVITRHGAEKVSLDDLLQRADFVSVNCPLTAETRGMIGAAQYHAMKPDAYFINTARGGIHDEMALADALRQRRIAGAGLDVWEEEPPDLRHPLLGFDNVLATPHNAGVTRQSYRMMAEGAARQWLTLLKGERPPRLLNPEAWPAYRERFARILGSAPVG